MSEMVDRVAEAVRDGLYADLSLDEIARSALEAMREPPPGLAERAVGGMFRASNEAPNPFSANEARVYWRAMIDAALA